MGTSSINSSLWTISLELKLYLALLFFWLIRIPGKKYILIALLIISIVAGQFFAIEIDEYITRLIGKQITTFGYLTYGSMFLAGVCCYVFRNKITIKPYWIFLIALLFTSINIKNSLITGILLIAVLNLFVAVSRVNFLKKITPNADLSYGIYVFAFPVQQVVANYLHPDNTWSFFFLVLVCILPLAIFSWYLIERKALHLKKLVR